MSDDDDNVIQFPSRGGDEKSEDDSIIDSAREIMSEGCTDPHKMKMAMIAIATISVATLEQETSEECKEVILSGNFPCSTSCGCYVHLIAREAFNVMFDKDVDGRSADLIMSEFLGQGEIDRSNPRKPPE